MINYINKKACKKITLTKQKAHDALEYIKKNRHKWQREQRIYFCDLCNGWHLTSLLEYREGVQEDCCNHNNTKTFLYRWGENTKIKIEECQDCNKTRKIIEDKKKYKFKQIYKWKS